jgi:hypothetical protein
MKPMFISTSKFAPFLAIALLSTASLWASDPLVLFEAMDDGNIVFTGQTSANLTGSGIANTAGEVTSAGAIAITGPATICANGLAATIAGVFTAATGAIKYTISNQLCPTAVAGVYQGIGSFTITGGTGSFVGASGGGLFHGLADFTGFKYHCFLQGLIFH